MSLNEKTPSEEYNLPVIGTIQAQLKGATMNGQPMNFPVDEYEVIKILEDGDGNKIYVCNEWNSYGKPQLVPGICVLRFDEK